MSCAFSPQAVTLTWQTVRLEPLSHAHAEDLLQAGVDRTIWTYMPVGGFPDLPSLHEWIDKALEALRRGVEVPFAAILLESGRAVGSTRYMDIRPEHRGMEIGSTWLSPEVQRSRVNTECKYLLLK